MKRNLIFALLLITVLLTAGYLRFVGINWDENQHLHPDERFLTDVVTRIGLVESLAEYFDTARSNLNPNNHGLTFFVYGTLPIFMVRYAAEWVGITGFEQIQLVGRALSALADLGLVYLVYLIGRRLFDQRIGLLAAAFSAFTVLQIQQSHFFTVDNFTNFFTYLAIFFAIRIASHKGGSSDEDGGNGLAPGDFLLFGLALGLAVASKVSVAPLAIVLPAALALYMQKLKPEERLRRIGKGIWYLFFAGLISFIVFRIFQPYAFAGPSFFNFALNPHWVDTMRSLRGQVTGDFDWPPSMQWARRPTWFAFQHMTLWGMGLPLAIVAWSGFAWAGWKLYKEKWQKPEVLLWGWGAAYFVWQSLVFNPTMRYLLPVYPALAVFAAWFLVRAWDDEFLKNAGKEKWRRWIRPLAGLAGGAALIATAFWAFSFVQIYPNEHTRIEAARWIYQNIPGPITLNISGEDADIKQPIPYLVNYLLDAERPLLTNFRTRASGSLDQISLHHVVAPLRFEINSGVGADTFLVVSDVEIVDWLTLDVGSSQEIIFSLPVGLLGQQTVTLNFPVGEGQILIEQVEVGNSLSPAGTAQLLIDEAEELAFGESFSTSFFLDGNQQVDQVRFQIRVLSPLQLDPVDLHLVLATSPDMTSPLAESRITVNPESASGGLVAPSVFILDQAVDVDLGQQLYLLLENESGGAITLLGSATVNETSWDDGLPLRIDGYDGFGGIYQGDLNFEMYWDEDPAKVERFLNNLEKGEYLFITSSRQWASLPRIPERYPLVSAYYRLLLGCPEDYTIEWCYNRAQIGSFEGQLGYELVQIFESSPQLGSLLINDQAADEAFTVYDHPKVFIFEKRDDYDHAQVTALLSAVDISNVERVTPKQATGSIPLNLSLPEIRWAEQRAGGSWADLFDTANWVNASPWVSAVIWYLALGLLGVAVFPLLRMALPGLDDGGYPLARLSALLLLSYSGWLAGSLGLSNSRVMLSILAGLLVLAGGAVAYRQRGELIKLWQSKRHYFYRTELIFLGFFLLMLLIRWGNPDLWHPWKGGEKPMDFSYFNAVLKSSTFPPYDPWFSGGYINYYYYGFVLVGSLTKLLGIVPSVAYNLILPTLFAMLALGAYSVAWNLFSAWKDGTGKTASLSPGVAGLAAAIGVVLAGNLASMQMILKGYQRLGSLGENLADAAFLSRVAFALRGFWMNIQGSSLPFGLSEWYWNPTRIIPAPDEAGPITEFPLFTFTYGDLHAHMIALPLTLLALAWALSAVLSRVWEGGRSPARIGWSLLFGGIAIGSLRPTNTWDFPSYLVIGAVAAAYAIWRYWPRSLERYSAVLAGLKALGGAALLVAISFLAYQPYSDWYRQPFTAMELWQGSHTPTSVYLLHWGAFLFFIVAWMAWETRQWLANTPLSSLRKLEPYRIPILVGFLFMLALIAGLMNLGVEIGWLVFPLMLWAGLLILRPGQPEAKQLVLFLIGTGLFLSLMVETVRLSGDVSRMNTVFKFYMQVWVLFALGAGMSLAWIVNDLGEWSQTWRRMWLLVGTVLVSSAALFLFLGVSAKVQDRMATDAPRGLDGMAYMQYAVYQDKDQELKLYQDYEAIRWLQENVEGSPVIVEAHTGEYRWGARITIYTGLPNVIGWNWHQRQQREFAPGNDIWGRAADVQEFYESEDLGLAKAFLEKYQVEYIILGQLEQAYYPGIGLEKFAQQEGLLWREVFRFEDTLIYEVLDPEPAEK